MDSQHKLENLPAALVQDIEFTGKLNLSTGQGAKFALLMAMLAKDVLARPKFIENHEPSADDSSQQNLTSPYPVQPLRAEQTTWSKVDVNTHLVSQSIRDAQLWLTMHPVPLSLHDDPKRLEDEVVANCDYQTQLRLNASSMPQEVEVDETGLYDVLESLQVSPLIA